jgi:RHS repeat-associated protein
VAGISGGVWAVPAAPFTLTRDGGSDVHVRRGRKSSQEIQRDALLVWRRERRVGGDDAVGNRKERLHLFRGKRVARRDASGNIFPYFADHLGSSRKIEEVAAGASTASLCYDGDYYPFGRENSFSDSCPQNYKFTGKERDGESGLDYFGARYYANSLGRFMSPDPANDLDLLDPQKLNRYTYARDNPLAYLDTGGRCVAPALGKGQAGICVESYIRAARLGFGKVGLGDNRGPVANDASATFRTQTLVTVDLRSRNVSETTTPGTTQIFWKGAFPRTGVVVDGISGKSVDAKGDITFTLDVRGLNGQAAMGNPMAPQGWIEMHFTFLVKPDGTVKLVKGSTKQYPSISVYSYSSNGKSRDLFQQTESGNPADLSKPASPVDVLKPSPAVQEEMQRQCRLGNPAACD